jgi:hypothetical protein
MAAREADAAAGAAATAAPGGGPRVYAAAEVIQFSQQAAAMDRLKIGDKYAQRWLAPGAPFEIADPVEPTKKYPSVEHFMAAMKYKVATDKPGLADSRARFTRSMRGSARLKSVWVLEHDLSRRIVMLSS